MASPQNAATAETTDIKPPEDNVLLAHIRPYAQKKEPALLLGLLFASSTVIPPSVFGVGANIPSYLHRAGFGAIFGGAAYVLSTGDIRNGSGITTAWSMTYLLLHLRKSLAPPRHPLGLALSGGAIGCAALYGTEYFWFQS